MLQQWCKSCRAVDSEEQAKVNIPTGVDLEDVFPLVEKARVGPDAVLEEDVETAEVESRSGTDFITTEIDLKTGAGFVAALSGTEDVRGCVGLHIEADSAVHPEETNDAGVKKVRKAESMETALAEPLVAPYKKMKRTDDVVLSVESETERK